MNVDRLAAALEKFHAGENVTGEILCGGGHDFAGGSTHPAIVHAQHRDSFPGQMICQHQKWAVPHQRFIAILLARSGDE